MLRFARLESHPILFDGGHTGEFADELRAAAAQEQIPPWCAYIGWNEDSPVVMGGFTGPPSTDHSVEIGYLTFTTHQGRGHATSMATFLVEVARRHEVRAVIAHTLKLENASTRVLRRCGFYRIGVGMDDDVRQVWRWELNL